jgi:hypothetical protein
MPDRLQQVLSGGLGYFWLTSDSRLPGTDDVDPQRGFIRRSENTIEVDLLIEDPESAWRGEQPLPHALLGATEHTGVLLLDVFGSGRTLNTGASRASVDRYRAQTLIVDARATDITSTLVNSASAYFHGDSLLSWANFDPVERQVRLNSQNRVESVRIDLQPTEEQNTRLRRGLQLILSGHWNVSSDDDRQHIVETALEIRVDSSRPTDIHSLVTPLLRCQDLLSLAFGGFVTSRDGRALCAGQEERAQLWNSQLMPNPLLSGIRIANRKSFPQFRLLDLGGVDSLRRWASLCETHPRAAGPLVNRVRRGAISHEVLLLEIASAIEYWGAAHRRTAKWAQKGSNFAEALGLHVGDGFQEWCGDLTDWSGALWSHYNGLKHDPSFVYDIHDVRVLSESALLLLTVALLNRIAGSKQPGRRLFSDHRNDQLRSWTRNINMD